MFRLGLKREEEKFRRKGLPILLLLQFFKDEVSKGNERWDDAGICGEEAGETLGRMEAVKEKELKTGKREKSRKVEISKSADDNKLPSTDEESRNYTVTKNVEEISNEANPISRSTKMCFVIVNHH